MKAGYSEKKNGRKTGTHIVEVTFGGQRTRGRFDNAREGTAWYGASKAIGAPAPLPGRTSAGTFGTAVEATKRANATWANGRDVSLGHRLEDIVALVGATTPLVKVPEKINVVVEALAARPGRFEPYLSKKTINRYLAVLSAVFTQHGMKVALPWCPEPRGRLEFYTREHAAKVLEHLEPGEALTFRTLGNLALRPGEFFTLEPDQIEVLNGPTSWVRLWETKTDRPRSVPISTQDAVALRSAVEFKRLPTHAEFYKRLKAVNAKLGLRPKLCVYSLRHSGGTWMAQDGVSGPVIQKFMGHSNFATTQNYLHLSDEDLLRVHEARHSQGALLNG